ncbi:MAG: hypothetical protein K9G29_05365 [Crocinitomicaceae bacterium]|nr:hypothetical protein [Crocinitomicaceae bacterium]
MATRPEFPVSSTISLSYPGLFAESSPAENAPSVSINIEYPFVAVEAPPIRIRTMK